MRRSRRCSFEFDIVCILGRMPCSQPRVKAVMQVKRANGEISLKSDLEKEQLPYLMFNNRLCRVVAPHLVKIGAAA